MRAAVSINPCLTIPIMRNLFRALEDVVYDAAEWIRKPRRRKRRWPAPRRRGGGGRTLRPGAQTPLWNALVKQALPYLGKRGSKVRLARFLGLPKQRMQDCLKARHAALDAERTLRFFCWITARQQGTDLSSQWFPR